MNTQTDTHSNVDVGDAFSAGNEHTQSYDSVVDDIILGVDAPQDDAFQQPAGADVGPGQQAPTNQQPAPGQQAPAGPQPEPGQQAPAATQPPHNDEVRYEYWQSQADKRQNEINQLQQTNTMLQNQMNQLMQNQPQEQPQPANQSGVQAQEFPPAPERPQQPRGFSREEASADPYSESAKYLDAVEQWRDDISEYNHLRNEYDREMLAYERQQFAEQQQRVREAQQAEAQQREQVANVKQQVMQQYGATAAQADDFITQMSNPQSLTVENLWRIYTLDASQPQAAPQGVQQPVQIPAQPSPAFQQTELARQIPSSMGVIPSTNRQTDRSAEDSIMDNMISDYNNQNPWS